MEAKLLIFNVFNPVKIRPAKKERDLPPNALRCLPMSIAAQYGYELLINNGFTITWNGGPIDEDTTIVWDKKPNIPCAWVNGGNGFFSFNTNLMIRTPENYNIYMTGPPNLIKRGVQAMTALIETDWNVSHVSMNYKMTEPNYPVRFEKDDPYCIIFPIQRRSEEEFKCSLELLSDHPEEYNEFMKLRESLQKADGDRQGHYRRGVYHNGEKCPVDHQRKLNVPDIDTSS